MPALQGPDDRHLLIRVRLLDYAKAQPPDCLSLEVEAQVDHNTIYPAGRVEVDLAQLRRAAAAPGNEYGRLLGQRLASGLPLQTALVSVARSSYLRIQLMLEPTGYPLSALRWERIEFSILGCKKTLSVGSDTPFSRFASVNREEVPAPADAQFRLLVIVASPHTLPPVDAAAEIRNLIKACGGLLEKRWMHIDFLPGLQGLDNSLRKELTGVLSIIDGPCTTGRVADSLSASGNPISALHIIAHGSFHADAFHLLLEDEQGDLNPVPGDDLIRAWQPDRLRLVYLQSCQSAVDGAAPPNDPRPYITGFMQSLVEAGVPGVVGMQDFIGMDDAHLFCKGFYSSLLRDGIADRAVNAGRALIPDVAANWSIPAFSSRMVGSSVWIESPLRAAEQKLKRKIESRWISENYRPLPIDVLSIGKAALQQRAPQGADEFATLSRQSSIQLDAGYAVSQVAADPASATFTAIIGPRGRHKTYMLEKVFLEYMRDHSESLNNEGWPVCVMLRLSDCAHPAYDPEMTVARAVAALYEDLTGSVIDPRKLTDRFELDAFLFLVIGDDNVGRVVSEGLRLLSSLPETFKQKHRFVLTLDQNVLRVRDLPDGTQCLIVQPMRPERVREFLSSSQSSGAECKVADLLEKNALYDLAEVPWLLSEMLDQARRGTLKASRAEILGRVVSDGVARYTGSAASASRVRGALQRFAWELSVRRDYFLPGSEAYEILQEVRGNRDYPLFGFLTDMVTSCNILASIGEDGIGFNFPGFRTYCAAEYLLAQTPDRRTFLLEDITAQLGRQSRAELWRETLFILAGMWDQTTDLLSMVLSGSLLQQGEQVFVAARCLQEARLRFQGHPGSDEPIVQSIVGTLLQMANFGLRSVSSRNKAIQHLGPLREASALRPLTNLVLDRQRQGSAGELRFDYSSVRLTAMKALAYSLPDVRNLIAHDPVWSTVPDLDTWLDAWAKRDITTLIRLLKADEPVSSVSAFALVLTRNELVYDALVSRFDDEDVSADTLWAITDSLIDLAHTRLPEFVAAHLKPSSRADKIAYIIGKMGMAKENSPEWAFLQANLASRDRRLGGRSLLALAELSSTGILDTCHQWLREPNDLACYFAMQALRSIGNWDSLKQLENVRWDAAAIPNNKIFFLDSVRQEVYEAIYWRLAGGLARETMSPIFLSTNQNQNQKQMTAGA